jgi:hypothetical protein
LQGLAQNHALREQPLKRFRFQHQPLGVQKVGKKPRVQQVQNGVEVRVKGKVVEIAHKEALESKSDEELEVYLRKQLGNAVVGLKPKLVARNGGGKLINFTT